MEIVELFAWMKTGGATSRTLSIILLIAMFFLLAIGMPLGFASAFLAVLVVLIMKFGPGVSVQRVRPWAAVRRRAGRLSTDDELCPDIGALVHLHGRRCWSAAASPRTCTTR